MAAANVVAGTQQRNKNNTFFNKWQHFVGLHLKQFERTKKTTINEIRGKSLGGFISKPHPNWRKHQPIQAGSLCANVSAREEIHPGSCAYIIGKKQQSKNDQQNDEQTENGWKNLQFNLHFVYYVALENFAIRDPP